MAATSTHLLTIPTLLLLLHLTNAAPAPSPSTAPANLTAILSDHGGFASFARLLAATRVDTQITNQLNTSAAGISLLAPSDAAFAALKPGTINALTQDQQVQLVLFHVIPNYYTWDTFQTASNPVHTQAAGPTGNWGFNITALAAQRVNVSTGLVQTEINSALVQEFPLAVYRLEKVLLPDELFGSKANAAGSSPSATDGDTSPPPTEENSADGPSGADDESGAGGRSLGLALVAGLWALCMGMVI